MTTTTTLKAKATSRVLDTNAADPKTAHEHFQSRLSFETDPSDVYTDLQSGEAGIIVIDARTPEAYAKGHVPGALNLPYRKIDSSTTASLSRDRVIVTYCDGVFCNASTKAAARLSGLGFRVKEMLDGMDGWKREGYPVETGLGPVRFEP
jgi:rhodanese-related sulfurtransferase